MTLLHGATMQLSQTKLLFHIHDGYTTCGHCEPGLLLQQPPILSEHVERAAVPLTHKQELKQIKKRYGLADQSKNENGFKFIWRIIILFAEYLIQQCTTVNDRAAQRRKQVGSSDRNEKTETASVET